MNIITRNNLTDLVGQLPDSSSDQPVGTPSNGAGNDDNSSPSSNLNDNQAVDEHGEVVDLGFGSDYNVGDSSNRKESSKDSDDLDYFIF